MICRIFAIAFLVSFTRHANADDADSSASPTKPHLQIALRTGYAIPFGSAASGLAMSNGFGGQVPFVLDLGSKVNRYIFIGAYLGLAFGGCGNDGHDCSSITFDVGPEIVFSMRPRASVNPWIGYGLGLELANSSNVDTPFAVGGHSAFFSGYQLGQVMAGVDFRIPKTNLKASPDDSASAALDFSVGPFVDFAMSTFESVKISPTPEEGFDESGNLRARFHEWLTLGVKGTLFP